MREKREVLENTSAIVLEYIEDNSAVFYYFPHKNSKLLCCSNASLSSKGTTLCRQNMAPIPLPPEPEFCLWVCWRSSPPFSCFGVTGVSTGAGASSWPPWNCCCAVTAATACEYTSSEYAVAEIVLPSVGRAETRVVACSCVVGVSPVEGFKITTQFLHPQVIYFKFISFSYMYYGRGIWYFPMKIWSEHIKNEYINQ